MERAYKPAPIWLTEIFDPVAGVAYLLDDQKRSRTAWLYRRRGDDRTPANPRATIEKLDSQRSRECWLSNSVRKPRWFGTSNLTIELGISRTKLTLVTKSSNGYTTG